VSTAAHNLWAETRHCADDYAEQAQERKLAQNYWSMAAAGCPGRVFSEDYASGFEDGFVDYLHNGGAGLPPPLPPDRYRKARYETPDGHVAIEQWFDGFRDGAAAARESGYRNFVTMPVALVEPPLVPPQPHVLRHGAVPLPEMAPTGEFPPAEPIPAPTLPVPQKLQSNQVSTRPTTVLMPPMGPTTVLLPPLALPMAAAPEVHPQVVVDRNLDLVVWQVPTATAPEVHPQEHVQATPAARGPSPLAIIRSVAPRVDPIVVLTCQPLADDDDDADDGDDDSDETPAQPVTAP
jgi:hypothetical protein